MKTIWEAVRGGVDASVMVMVTMTERKTSSSVIGAWGGMRRWINLSCQLYTRAMGVGRGSAVFHTATCFQKTQFPHASRATRTQPPTSPKARHFSSTKTLSNSGPANRTIVSITALPASYTCPRQPANPITRSASSVDKPPSSGLPPRTRYAYTPRSKTTVEHITERMRGLMKVGD